jgi:hypothetical protein
MKILCDIGVLKFNLMIVLWTESRISHICRTDCEVSLIWRKLEIIITHGYLSRPNLTLRCNQDH